MSKYEFVDSENVIKTFDKNMNGIIITNLGEKGIDLPLTINIGSLSFTVKAGETYRGNFEPFNQLSVNSTSKFHLIVLDYIELKKENFLYKRKYDNIPPIVRVLPNGGTFSDKKSISIVSNEQADIFYTLDGSEPTISSVKYTEIINISETTTLKVFAVDSVGNQSSIQTISFVKDTNKPILQIIPPPGEYAKDIYVKLTSDKKSTIFYTTNSDIPTINSAIYSGGSIKVNKTQVIKYFAIDEAGNKSEVENASYVINMPTNLNLSVTNGLVSTYNFTAHQNNDLTVIDPISANNMTLDNFLTGTASYDGGLGGDGTSIGRTSNLLSTPSSYTLFATYKWLNVSQGSTNILRIAADLCLTVWATAYQLTISGTNYPMNNSPLFLFPSHQNPDTITLRVDNVANTVDFFINGIFKVQYPYTVGTTLPTLTLFDGNYSPGAVNSRGFQIFNNCVFYNRALSDSEIAEVYLNVKRDPDVFDTKNSLTSVENGLIEAYDFTIPFVTPILKSQVGNSAMNSSTSPTRSDDGSVTIANMTYKQRIAGSNNMTHVVKFALGAVSGNTSICTCFGATIRHETGFGGRVTLFCNTTMGIVPLLASDQSIHTVAFTVKDIGDSYEIKSYLDGIYNQTTTVTKSQVTGANSNAIYGCNYPTVLSSSVIKKYAILQYNKTLADSEILQIHNDLMNK